jgi:protein SMG6
MQHISPSRQPTKQHRTERDVAPVPTDIAEKMIAFKRKQASHIKVKDRAERSAVSGPQNPPSPPRRQPPTSAQSPPTYITRPEPDSSEFSRALKLSPTQKPPAHAQAHKPHPGKLFNPDTDPIPMRRPAEYEAESESAGSSYPPRPPPESSSRHRDASQHRQLFDPRKHDPVTFSAAQARKPAPKSSGDYASVSSTSSYTVSSNFTLSSSTTDDSSTPSSLFDNNKPRDDSNRNAFTSQLKKLYRDVCILEAKLLNDAVEPQDENRILIKGGPAIGGEDAEKARWKKAIEDHKL